MTFDEALQQIMEEEPETREIIESAIKLAEDIEVSPCAMTTV